MFATQHQLRGLMAMVVLVCGHFVYAAPPDTMTVHYYFRDTFCTNQSLFIGNRIFDKYNPSGTVLLPGAAADGSDSLIHVDLVYREPSIVNLQQDLCAGDTLWVNGHAYHSSYYVGEETIEGGAANGCDSIIEVHLHIVPTPAFLLDDTLCPQGFLMVNAVRYDRDHPAGMEILPGMAASGCDSLVTIALTFQDFQLDLGPDRDILSGDTVCISPVLNFTPANLVWLPESPCADPACSPVCLQPAASIIYQLTATGPSGCVLTDALQIAVTRQDRVYVPNAFNPDADEPNNRFFLSTDAGVSTLRRLFITDRWGETLFDAMDVPPNQPEAGWDGRWRGKPVLPGVYVYWVELERLDGSRFHLSGTVSVVR